jgi:hypothetical protein
MSPQKIKFWYRILTGDFLFASFVFLAASFFAEFLGIDSGGEWGTGRILFAVLGFALGIIPIVLWLPGVRRIAQNHAAAQFTRYSMEFVLWLFVALGLCEMLLQMLVLRKPEISYEKDWEVVPLAGSIRFWGKEGFGVTHYLSHGEIATPFDDGTISVVVLGDSHTEALQVADNVKYVSIAETKIRNDGEFVNLHNLGVSGDSLPDYIYFAPVIKQDYNPDIVVIQLGPQDFYGEDGGESFDPTNRNYFVINADDGLELRHPEQRAKSGLYNKLVSRIIVYSFGWERISRITEKMNEKPNTDGEPSPARGNDDTILPASRLDEQLQLLRDAYAGLKVILLLLPDSPNINGGVLNFDDAEYQKLLSSAEKNGQFYIVNPQSEFDQIAALGILPRGFINSSLAGSGHFNETGHTILGELLAEKILEILP